MAARLASLALEGAFHMGKLFKINSLKSDGTETNEPFTYEVIDPDTSKPYVDDEGNPSVVVTLKPISPTTYRRIQADHTQRLLNKHSRAMEEVTDWDAVQDSLVAYSVMSWTGFIGADFKPLECCLEAKINLPGDLKNDLVKRSMQGESVDKASSFRATA